MTAGNTITPQTGGTFALQLGGGLPPEWVGSLCSGLSAKRINVESGYARQVQRGNWESLFVVRPMSPEIDAASIDYRAMALAPKVVLAGRTLPLINSFQLDQNDDSLFLTIRANDELGLLARLLSGFSFLMLFAHEMKIETVGVEAQDTFVLRGFGGAAPTPDKSERLHQTLRQMSEPRNPR